MGAIDSRQLRLSRVNVSGVGRDLDLAGTLGAMESLSFEFASPVEIVQDQELSKHQFAILLLQTAADIEHALLVQYLYAAYSLKLGLEIPGASGFSTDTWQDTILGIAREEMGHLLSVQNLLRAIGGPLRFEREGFPYRSQLYPFPFVLEPLTKNSLAKYVAAEMPEDVDPKVLPPDKKKELWARVTQGAGGMQVNHVGTLYAKLISVFESLDDSDFRVDAVPWQAGVEWRGNNKDDELGIKTLPIESTQLINSGMNLKDVAVRALRIIARQGEGITAVTPSPSPISDDSHFIRFYNIYKQFADNFDPALPVPLNPNTTSPPAASPSSAEELLLEHKLQAGRIKDTTTLLWAHLFNLRYRILLTELSHDLTLPGTLPDGTAPAKEIKQKLLAWAFSEMHDRPLSSLANVAIKLTTLPQGDISGKFAGAPFELPYTLALPDRGPDRWRLHLDLLDASIALIDKLIADPMHPDPVLKELRDFEDSDDGSGVSRRQFLLNNRNSIY
jgi:hypothetical protein